MEQKLLLVDSPFFASAKENQRKAASFSWMLPLMVLFTFLFGNKTVAQVVTTSSTGNYTWTVPCGVSSITVEVWGAGGGGAGASGNPANGGGGSGGGYIKTVYTVTPGTTYSLYAGVGGTGGTTGTDGEASWFNTNAIIKAIGGKGAGAAISSNSTYGSGAVAYTTGNLTSGTVAFTTYGGSGANADATYSGAGGSSAGSTAAGNGTTSTGGIAPTNGYAGADGISSGRAGGNVGGIGAGGSGGKANNATDQIGGAGGRGQVKITYTSAYCSPAFTGLIEPITNVTFAGINNTTSATVGGTPSFESICLTGSVVQGSGTNAISLKGNTNGAYTDYFTVYIDWNQNGVLNDAGEVYAIGTINSSTGVDATVVTGNIAVPGTATLGTTRMRIIKKYNAAPTGPCESGALDGQTEDYNLTIVVGAACATPTAQPTTLVLTPTGSTIGGTFTLASPVADNYLVLINTTGVAPAPVNGTTYSAGNTIGSSTVVDVDGNNTFTATGLSGYTTYYIYVFSYNSACTGGPLYFTTSPLNGSTTTLAPTYCASSYTTGTSYYIGNVTTAGINNTSTNTEGVPMYADYTAITGGMIAGSSYTFNGTINTGSNAASVYVWVDWNKDGVFNNTTYPGGERYSMSGCGAGSVNCPVSGSITVPAGALSGNTRMRVSLNRDGDVATAGLACQTTALYGETEDYTITVAAAVACVTPTAQPTALILTPSGNSIAGTFTAASPVPNNYLVVISTVNSAPTLVNGTTYAVGNTIGSSTVVDIDGNTTFTASGLIQLTPYYVFVFSYNSLCTGGPLYYTTTPLNGSATTLGASYCTPTGTLNCTLNDYISNVTFNTLNNSSICGAGGYTVYAATGAQTTTVMKGTSYNLSLSVGAGSGTHGAGVWIDFNQNGLFTDAGEFFLVSNTIAANSTTTISIPIPVGASAGPTQMRVRFAYNTTVSSTMSCTTTGTYGETEDYTITLSNPAACVTPTAQPTALVLTPTSTTIGGSFTYPSPAANNYLVIINTTNAVPVPVNGTTYAIGGTVGAGNTVVDIDGNNTFLASGLSSSTTYFIYVFSYNSLCTGGPLYYTTTPLNGTSATLAPSLYCTPSVTSGWESWSYISNVSFVGTLNDTSNNSTYTATPLGYQDYTGLTTKSSQAQGEGVNIFVQAKNTSFMKAWVDWNKDGDFVDAGELVYDTGGVATYSTTFGFIIPGATAVGDYRVRIRTNSKDTSSPFDANSTPTFTSCGNINYGGETEDYLFTVVASCASLITSVTDGVTCGPGTVNLTVTGSAGVSSYKWYSALTGGTLIGTTASGTWTTPSLSTTTTYYVTAINVCESLVRTAVIANVNPVPTLNFSPISPTVCGENTVLTLNASGDKQQTYLINENFEAGGLGSFTNTNIISNSGAINALTMWQNRTSTFVPAQQVWFPAISSGFGTNKFVMTTSDVGTDDTHNALISATINSTNYLDLTLTFKAFYSRYYIDETAVTLDYMTVDVSTNGGGAWTELTRYTSDIGIGTRFQELSFNLNAYINQPNLKIRIRYYGEWADGIAIDDVKLYGYVPLNTAFSWTSDSPVNAFADFACTIPYSTAVPTVYIKPTLAQLETGSWNFTAIATLANGCSASQPITVTNNSKVWQTTASTDWNTASNWKPVGVPTSSNCVIVPNNTIISGSGYDAYAKNVTVKSTGILDVLSSNNLTVTEWVNVNAGGTFNVKNNASLVQIDNVANTGIMNMERTANMRKLDYVYWASPVASFASNAISPGTSAGYLYKWTPTIGSNTNGWGNWAGGNETMTLGKGYIVRGPDSFTTTLANYTANFSGVPNNGIVTSPISRGTYDGADYVTTASATLATKNDDNWNLMGNPYPSAVNAISFLTANTNIDGFIKVWTHGTLPSTGIADPFYNNFVYNYTSSDYITYNASGTSSGPGVFGGSIGAGQGFFVLMNHTSAGTSENVTFTNSMRSSAYSNSQFFRNTVDSENENGIEKNRIWLDLVSPTNTSIRTLVGYIGGATNSKDRLFDAIADTKANFNIYSITDNEKVSIQGRALPFDNADTVPMGITIPQNGIYTFAIAATDGLFSDASQNIYIEDLVTGISHNLRSAPYSFTAQAGNTDNRFVLRYTQSTLGTDTFDLTNTVKVTVNEKVTVRSSDQPIKNIDVFDILGRKIDSYKNVDATQFILNQLNKTMTTLILKITLENDAVVTEKIIY